MPDPIPGQPLSPALRSQVTVMSDGVDCAVHRPDAAARIDFDWLRLPADRPVVTYATRGMQPLRGFPHFLRAIQTCSSSGRISIP